MVSYRTLALAFEKIFLKPVSTKHHWGMTLVVGLLFIFTPQHLPNDWVLNTKYFWSNGLDVYQYPGNVYPPWGLILMVPYYLIGAAGARFFSVLVIGWLAQRRGWSLARFLLIVMGPYFFVTLSKSNMDIFVFVFPVLLWERAEGTSWQSLGRGLSLSIYLLKPQGAILIWLYLLWTQRENWQEMIKPLLIVSIIVLPISLIGSPPLVFQWINNVLNPPPDFEYYWATNNISLTNFSTPLLSIVIVIISFVFLRALMRWSGRTWSQNHTLASLFMASMFLSPYTSQQSFSSGLAFLPSFVSYLFQFFILIISFSFLDFFGFLPLWVFSIAIVSLFFYRPHTVATSLEDAS